MGSISASGVSVFGAIIAPGQAMGVALAFAIGLVTGALLALVVGLLVVQRTLRRRAEADAARIDERLARLTALIESRLTQPDARSIPAPHQVPADPEHAEPIRRRRRPEPAEVLRLAQRGRHSVEIAQLLDADIGEVELILRLDAARAESVSARRSATAAPKA